MFARHWFVVALAHFTAIGVGACAGGTRIDYMPEIQLHTEKSEVMLVNGATISPILTERYSVEFKVMRDRINIRLINRLHGLLKIIWDDAVFVDFSGQSNGVVHTGVRLIERDKSQVPSSVAPNSFINDAIIPKSNVDLTSSGWRFSDILPTSESERIALKGKSFKIILPIESSDGVRSDEFAFKIVDFNIVKSHVPGLSEIMDNLFKKTEGAP